MKTVNLDGDSIKGLPVNWKTAGAAIEREHSVRTSEDCLNGAFTDRAEEIAEWLEETIGAEFGDWCITQELLARGSQFHQDGQWCFNCETRTSVYFRTLKSFAIFKIVWEDGQLDVHIKSD